jgi:hypothetical protein
MRWRGSPATLAGRGSMGSVPTWDVARQRLLAVPRRQARPKGSPGAKNVAQGLFLKIIFKKG